MAQNTIKTNTGIEIYKSSIEYYADDYINKLPSNLDIYNSPNLFNGMVKNIYINVFKDNPVDTQNIGLLYDLWNVYTNLCYRYNKIPTILNFSLFSGISADIIYNWSMNRFDSKYNANHHQFAETINRECEASLRDTVGSKNSVGSMFLLKACHGYVEAPQRIELTTGSAPQLSQDDIKAITAEVTGDIKNLDKLPE